MNFNSPRIRFALDAARQAAQVVQAVQHGMVTSALTKDDRSPVTVADFAAQAVVARLLEGAYPGTPLVGEEDATTLRKDAATLDQVTKFVGGLVPEALPEQVCDWIDHGNGEPGPRFWVLDPVDGTKGFLRGEQYAVALAYVEGGRVQLGVLACPNLTGAHKQEPGGPGTLAVAVRGEGAWARPLEGGAFEDLHVSILDDPTGARVLRSVEAGHTNVSQLDHILARMHVQGDPVRMDSQAKYAVLAHGAGDLLFRLISAKQPNYREKIWDQAAGSLVVEEAGGVITDLDGKPLDFTAGKTLANNRGVLASNGRLHDAALTAIRSQKA